jgi:hypothetical protein
MKFKTVLSYLWKLPLCGILFFAGLALSGVILPLAGFQTPEIPAGTDANQITLCFLEASMILAFVLSFLSKELTLKGWARWIVLAGLVWIAGTVGMVLESFFFMDTGAVSNLESSLFTMLNFLLPSLFLAGAVTWLFPPQEVLINSRNFQPDRSPTWKFALALFSYPVIYIGFGLLVQPYVSSFYSSGMYELTIPSWGQLIPLQLLRSVLFLGICYPVIHCWKGTPLKLWVALGAAFFILTAFMAVITSYWFPWRLRFFHGLELLADAMVYIGVLVYLLFPDNSWKAYSSSKSTSAFRSAVITILIISVFNLGCSAISEPYDQVYTSPFFTVSVASSSDQKIHGSLVVTNKGDSQFPADSAFEGQMNLWDQNGALRSKINVYELSKIQPGESLEVLMFHNQLDPGVYFLAWGSPKYGGVISGFNVIEESDQIRVGKSLSFRTKPVEHNGFVSNAGRVVSFSAEQNGSLFIAGETPLPDQNCLFAIFYNQDGLFDWYPPGQPIQITDGRWQIEILADSGQDGLFIQPDTSYQIILFSNDLTVPPSEPFQIFISPPLQK